jgi:HEAT repeat protein
MRRHSFVHVLSLMTLVGATCLLFASLAQSLSAQSGGDADAKVAAIMDVILKRGEGYAEGRPDIKTYTWIPPSPEDLNRIREIGHGAIAPLSKALEPPYTRPFQRTLAVRLLGEIGGADIVPPLKRALEPSNPNSVRVSALAALLNAPDDLAVPIIRNAIHDPDPAVAQRAKELLTEYYKLDVSK